MARKQQQQQQQQQRRATGGPLGREMAGLQDALAEAEGLGEAMEGASAELKDLARAVRAARTPFQEDLIDAVTQPFGALGMPFGIGATAAKGFGGMADAALDLTDLGVGLVDELSAAIAAAVPAAAGLAQKSASGGVGAAVSLSGGGAAGALGELAGGMKGFVEALNPASVQAFDLAMRDLQAVVGTALQPVFVVLTGAARQLGNLLLPVTRELAPVFSQLAGAVMQVAQPMMQQWVGVIRAGLGPLQMLADVVSGLAAPLAAWQTVLAAVIKTMGDALSGMFGGDTKSAMDKFKESMKQLATGVLVAVAALAKLSQTQFGFGGGLLDNLIQSLRGGPQGNAMGLAAATGGQVTSMQAWEQSDLARAFTASMAGTEDKSERQWLEDAAKRLEEIRDRNGAAEQWLRGMLMEMMAGLNGIGAALGDMQKRVGLTAAGEAAQRFHDDNPRTAEGARSAVPGGDSLRWLINRLRRQGD